MDDNTLYILSDSGVDFYMKNIGLLRYFEYRNRMINIVYYDEFNKWCRSPYEGHPMGLPLPYLNLRHKKLYKYTNQIVNAVTIVDMNTNKKTTTHVLADGIVYSPQNQDINDIIKLLVNDFSIQSKLYSVFDRVYTVKFKKVKTIASITYYNAIVKIKKDKNYWSNYV